MNTLSIPDSDSGPMQLQRRRALTGILEYTIASLELSEAQRTSVEATYKECGAHLTKALRLAQETGDIFPQGSMRLGTVIRPWRDITDVFDLDIVFRIVVPCMDHRPDQLRNAVGEHLRQKYNGAVKPLPKGWRLDFSKERNYYLDVIPAMDAPHGGNVIAITDAEKWRYSNPRDYAAWFERHASRMPRFEAEIKAFNERATLANSARIEPLPEHTEFKAPLQRIVQIAKRHRDYYFNKKTKQEALATASIVLTTLLTEAYSSRVMSRTFRSGFDLLFACVEDMPNYLKETTEAEATLYTLKNPSLPSENLVEKWKDVRYADAFYKWHKDFVGFLLKLTTENTPQRELLTEAFGETPVSVAFTKQVKTFHTAREQGILNVAPAIGLTIGTGVAVSPHVIHGLK